MGTGVNASDGPPPTHLAVAGTLGVVIATGLAGAALAALRLRSQSVIAPTLVHAALNMTAFAGVRVTS